MLATRVAYPSATQGKLHCGPLPVKREASTEYMLVYWWAVRLAIGGLHYAYSAFKS